MVWNVPNTLTFIRIISIPFILWSFSQGYQLFAGVLLGLSCLTDFFDGYFARKLNQCTDFGAIFDPIADKIIALSFYSYIFYKNLAPEWLVIIILLRNFAQVLSVPILIWWLKKTFKVEPKIIPKWTTAFSDIFLFFPLLIPQEFWRETILFKGFAIVFVILEFYIFITYVPRLVAIARGKHDTFE